MIHSSFIESIHIVAREMRGRYRLVYAGTGHPFLNLMGGPVDGGGYGSEQEATLQARRCTARLQGALNMGGVKPSTSNARALALVL